MLIDKIKLNNCFLFEDALNKNCLHLYINDVDYALLKDDFVFFYNMTTKIYHKTTINYQNLLFETNETLLLYLPKEINKIIIDYEINFK